MTNDNGTLKTIEMAPGQTLVVHQLDTAACQLGLASLKTDDAHGFDEGLVLVRLTARPINADEQDAEQVFHFLLDPHYAGDRALKILQAAAEATVLTPMTDEELIEFLKAKKTAEPADAISSE